MSLVSSVILIGSGPRMPEDVADFFRGFHAEIEDQHTAVPEDLSLHASGGKALELNVWCAAYNYLDVQLFGQRFEAFDWLTKPILVVRFHESDIIDVFAGDDARVAQLGERT